MLSRAEQTLLRLQHIWPRKNIWLYRSYDETYSIFTIDGNKYTITDASAEELTPGEIALKAMQHITQLENK